MIKFIIKAGGTRYEGLFHCSIDAALDAFARFGGCVSVRRA